MPGTDKKAPDKGVKEDLTVITGGKLDESAIEQEESGEIEDSSGEDNVKSLEKEKAKREPWRKKLITSGKNGAYKKLLVNILRALRSAPEWNGVLRYNGFSHQIEIQKKTPWTEPGEPRPRGQEHLRTWTEYDDMMLTEWLQERGIDVPSKLAGDAVYTIAREHEYHPVKNFLRGLRWDGVKRLDRWLITYFGAEDSIYHEEIGKRWLISGIARILAPGPDCKADCVLVLEGEQGLQKSTALRVLSAPWFLDDLRQFGSKDAAMKISGRWIIEIAELTAMNEVTVESCKAFFGQTMDCFRPPFGRRVIDAPRQCIFAASTNKNIFLKDETGDRRYWPVACTKIDIDGLKRDRDQLWAEAQVLFKDGHVWWIDTPELRALAEEEQHMRFEADPWEPGIRRFLVGQNETTAESILLDHFDYEEKEINKGMRNRVSSVLRHLLWQRVRSRAAKPKLGEKIKEPKDEYVWSRGEKTRK